MDLQLGDVVLRIGIAEGDLAGSVFQRLHGHDLGIHHIACQIAALPFGDGDFVPVDLAVVEYNNLLRPEIRIAGQDQSAGNDLAFRFVFVQHIEHSGFPGIVAHILIIKIVRIVRPAHGSIIGHIVPQDVGQPFGKLNDFDLLTVDAHRQCIDVFRLSFKHHAVLCGQGKGCAGNEALFAVDLRASFGLANGDLRCLRTGAFFEGDVIQNLVCGHALGQDKADGSLAIGKLDLGNGTRLFASDLLLGGIQGVEGHALFNRIHVAKARGAFLVHAPSSEGIALFGGVQALYRLGQQILAFGKYQRFQLTSAEGLKGDHRRVGFIDEAGVQGHISVHGFQTGSRSGKVSVFIPCGEDLSLQLGVRPGVIHHASGSDFLGFDGCTLGDEGHQPFVQYEIHLLARLQFHDLVIGAGHFKGFLCFVDHGTGSPDSQGIYSLLHTDHAQSAAALDNHFVRTLDDDLGKLRAGIHMKIDQVRLFFVRIGFFI